MKLLVITQKIDREDDILGFFHYWIEKLSFKVDFLNVICLYSGQYVLPKNVKVFSLGKEENNPKIKRFFNFFCYIWKLRKEYDAVFVHMNPVYIVLGGCFWKFFGKRIYLWHNHQSGNIITRLAVLQVNKVFHTSPFAFSSRFKKAIIMPAGIDTNLFKKDNEVEKIPNSILFLGRIAPIKNLDVLIRAAKLLDKDNHDFILNIVGEPGKEDQKYFEKIQKTADSLEKKGKLKFFGKLPNYKIAEIYNKNEIFINLSPSGLFDKAILEAMACELPVLVSSKAFLKKLPEKLLFQEKDAVDLRNKIIRIFNFSEKEKTLLGEKLRSHVVSNHSIDILINKLINEFKI